MSTATTKRHWRQAVEDAEAFRALFPPACYSRWEFAGSLRRKRPEVGDVEHVILPNFGDIEVHGQLAGLFVSTERVNLLFHHLDALLAKGDVSKHWYGNGYRWGDKHRGAEFRGFTHELFTADADNFGCQLLIRTGPAEFSERIVTRLKAGGMYRQTDGFVKHVESGQIVPVRDEAAYFALLGMRVIEPEKRA